MVRSSDNRRPRASDPRMDNAQANAGGLAPGDIDYHLTKMTLLGHMRKRLKSLVECKFSIYHRGDPVPLDETIHVFEILA